MNKISAALKKKAKSRGIKLTKKVNGTVKSKTCKELMCHLNRGGV